jgi:two-component system, NarL family, nitrate/nitrite response regulator NarL
MDVVESLRHERGDIEARAHQTSSLPSPETLPTAGARILVIDGNLLTAEAIVLALSQIHFAARFALPVTADHVRDLVSWKPGLALLDIDSVDPTTSVECVHILRQAEIPVAVMGGSRDGFLLGQCIQAGASSVVDKGSQLNELIGMIVRLLAGDVVMSEETKQRLTEPYQRESRVRRTRLAPFDVLTQREKYVLSELMDGHCADEIARRATVSISTVRSQIKAILQKLGVNSQLAVAALARQAGWTYDGTDRTADSEPGLLSRTA